jgi:DNA repair exonuclease SbcCD ATPase subunit
MMSDEVYQVPLAEFTKARDALAARLKAEGRKDESAAVKRAAKPSLPAWAANQVVWHAPSDWARLQAAAASLRAKHAEGASPEALREAAREQREALQACESRAAEALVRDGHAAGPTVLQKVSHSLLALASGAAAQPPGRLEHDLPPPGFDTFAGLSLAAPASRAAAPAAATPAHAASAPASAAKKPAAPPREDAHERARRRAALAAAEARHADSRRRVQKAEAAVAEADKHRQTLERQLEAARVALEDARRQLQEAAAEATVAERALETLRSKTGGD